MPRKPLLFKLPENLGACSKDERGGVNKLVSNNYLRILRTLVRSSLLILFSVPLVLIEPVQAQIVPDVQSIDVVYEIRMDSGIDVTESITFENVSVGEYVRKIPKRLSGLKIQDSRIKNQNVEGGGRNINYGIGEVGVFGVNGGSIKHKISEDNDAVKVTFDISNLPEDKRYVTLRYKIERAIRKIDTNVFPPRGWGSLSFGWAQDRHPRSVIREDDLNQRNNIELLGSLGVLGESKDENKVESVTARIKSPYADIATVECFAGDINSGQRMCLSEYDKNEGRVYSTGTLGEGKGMLISFKMMKDGDVVTPGKTVSFFAGAWDCLRINWVALASGIAGLLVIVYVFKRVFYIKFK